MSCDSCILFRPVHACSGLFDQFGPSELIFKIFQLWYIERTTVVADGRRTPQNFIDRELT